MSFECVYNECFSSPRKENVYLNLTSLNITFIDSNPLNSFKPFYFPRRL
ncbi:MAG TPA: hypothetical protein VF593_11020 [Chthoniobacteraceae bacterium]